MANMWVGFCTSFSRGAQDNFVENMVAGPFNRVYTVTNQTVLEMNTNLDYRATAINPQTNKPFTDGQYFRSHYRKLF